MFLQQAADGANLLDTRFKVEVGRPPGLKFPSEDFAVKIPRARWKWRTLYLSPPLTSLENKECRVMDVAPLLRELILRTVERAGLDSRVASDTWMTRLIEEKVKAAMAVAVDSPLKLPMPTDERVQALAHHVLAQPLNVNSQSVAELAQQHGVSRRTLERRFQDETGMSFGMWRQKARLLDSIRLPAEGKSVTDAALDSGYSSVSALIAAFKSTFGYTPGRL